MISEAMAKKKPHGGKRSGAGRPSSGKTVWLQLRLTPAQKAWLDDQATQGDTTVTAWAVSGWVAKGMPPTPEPKKA
jgi:hypothetical protein